MRYMQWLRILAVIGVMSLQTGLAFATPEVGWWWNPNESGRGFFVESQNGIIYIAGYFYESDGRATWLVAGGPNSDPYSYQGRLLAYSSGQTLLGDYKPPSAPTDAGAVSLHFTDDQHGSITWPGGTIPIVREIFGAGPAAFQPANGWWWNPDESGRGYSIEVQGDKVFVVSFMYDDNGKPVWYFSAGKMSSATTYSGPWLQFANGQTLTGPYHSPTAPVTVGQLALEFTATNAATMTFSDTAAATSGMAPKAGGHNRMIAIAREFPTTPHALPTTLDTDHFEILTEVTLRVGDGTQHETLLLTGFIRWVQAPNSDPDLTSFSYIPLVIGTLGAQFTIDLTTSDGASCHGSGTGVVGFKDNGSSLLVTAYLHYQGKFKITVPSFDHTVTCVYPHNNPPPYTYTASLGDADGEINPMAGVVGADYVRVDDTNAGCCGLTVTTSWNLKEVK